MSIPSSWRASAFENPRRKSFATSTATARTFGKMRRPSGVSSSLIVRRSSAERTRRTRPRSSRASILRVMAPGSWAISEHTAEAVSATSCASEASTT